MSGGRVGEFRGKIRGRKYGKLGKVSRGSWVKVGKVNGEELEQVRENDIIICHSASPISTPTFT